MVELSDLAFIVLPAIIAIAFAYGVARAWRATGRPERSARAATIALVATIAWMALTWAAAASGVLQRWDATPPPFLILVLAIVVIALVVAFGPAGTRLAAGVPLAALVAVQSFRLPLEIAMHRMYERGIMPGQMTYTGRNFDIVTGTTAIIVATLVASGRGGRRLVAVWNVAGLVLLLNVVIIAILSTPRFRYFGDDHLNVWVTDPPYVWLPAMLVLAALAGHLVIFRALPNRR